MEVADGGAEEKPSDEGEDRVAEIAVQRRHGLLRDAAGEAVAHHEVVAVAELGEKSSSAEKS